MCLRFEWASRYSPASRPGEASRDGSGTRRQLSSETHHTCPQSGAARAITIAQREQHCHEKLRQRGAQRAEATSGKRHCRPRTLRPGCKDVGSQHTVERLQQYGLLSFLPSDLVDLNAPSPTPDSFNPACCSSPPMSKSPTISDPGYGSNASSPWLSPSSPLLLELEHDHLSESPQRFIEAHGDAFGPGHVSPQETRASHEVDPVDNKDTTYETVKRANVPFLDSVPYWL